MVEGRIGEVDKNLLESMPLKQIKQPETNAYCDLTSAKFHREVTADLRLNFTLSEDRRVPIARPRSPATTSTWGMAFHSGNWSVASFCV